MDGVRQTIRERIRYLMPKQLNAPQKETARLKKLVADGRNRSVPADIDSGNPLQREGLSDKYPKKRSPYIQKKRWLACPKN